MPEEVRLAFAIDPLEIVAHDLISFGFIRQVQPGAELRIYRGGEAAGAALFLEQSFQAHTFLDPADARGSAICYFSLLPIKLILS